MGARGEMKEWKKVRPSGHHASLTLNDAVKMMPTPQARDWKEEMNPKPHGQQQANIPQMIAGTKTGLKLQPAFVEWMMGYPQDWTKLD
jgi:hypothetical protein